MRGIDCITMTMQNAFLPSSAWTSVSDWKQRNKKRISKDLNLVLNEKSLTTLAVNHYQPNPTETFKSN